jgi:hypothetical protein
MSKRPLMSAAAADRNVDYCTFCGLARGEVHTLVPAPLKSAFICDGCVGICFQIVREHGGDPMKGIH